MSHKDQPRIFSSQSQVVLVGEITEALRAQGNVSATGTIIDSSSDSPIVSGIYSKIPQSQVGFMTHEDFSLQIGDFKEGAEGGLTPWNAIGATSLDAVFAPFSTFYTADQAGGVLAHWTEPEGGASEPTAKELNPFNPFNNLQGMQIDGHEVDEDPWTSGGHNITFSLTHDPSESGLYPDGSGAPVNGHFEKDHFARHSVAISGIRGVGLKMPMVATGWGYDTDGNPVPAGTGTVNGVQNIDPEAAYNPATWKSGPVDLRWDNARGVWAAGTSTEINLVKVTNLYTPPSFSFEVDRSNTRDQYSRNAPVGLKTYAANQPIHDPEYLAYNANDENLGNYEQLDYDPYEFPFYEAFIIRKTNQDPIAANYYNIWSEDCQDCGHITNECASGTFAQHDVSGVVANTSKILIENPLRQSLDVGDLAFTVKTGRSRKVNTGAFTGGSGTGASGIVEIDTSGNASFTVTAGGSGYDFGGFALVDSSCNVCAGVELFFDGGVLSSGAMDPSSVSRGSGTCPVSIYPNDATVETETLNIHWILQAEFKSQQIVTHVECDNGILQSCSMKIQTQGYKTCEWCGEDTAYINS